MMGRRGRALRWTLLALAVAMVVPAAAGAQARFVYTSNGVSNDVSVLRINANGTLTPIGGSPVAMTGMTTSEGMAITPDADNLYVANYGTDRVSGFNVNATTGGLSATTGSPYGGPNSVPPDADAPLNAVLGVAPDPDGGHLFTFNHNRVPPSIGTWTIAGNGSLSEIGGSPNSDPAGHQDPFAGSVAPDGDHFYVPMENTTPGNLAPDRSAVFSVAANGALTFQQQVVSGDAAGADGNPFGSGILPNGQCVYVSAPEDLAGVGRVYGYTVDQTTGNLSAAVGSPYSVGAGNHPLTIAAAPDSQRIYVATRASNSVNGYNVAANCSLSAIPGSPFSTGVAGNGKSLAFTPDGTRIYVINNATTNVSGFNVNPTTGALTLIPGSPFGTGGTGADLESIAITPNQPPVAAFSPTTLAPAGSASSFNANATTDGDGGTIAQYNWDFGDGTTQANAGPTPSHTYTQPGNYTVELTVIDNEGCSTDRIFTGKATICNGGTGARISQQVTIQAAQQAAQCVVPDVVGLKKGKAIDAIIAANCTVGASKKKFSKKVKKKKVIKTNPKAGTTLPAGSPVDLKISKGKKKG